MATAEFFISGQGLSDEEHALLRQVCEGRSWHYETSARPGATLAIVAEELGLPAIASAVRGGSTVLALLGPHGAAQVAPSLRAGASDCLARPLDVAKTASVLERCLELRALVREVGEREDKLWQALPNARLAGESSAITGVLSQAEQAAEFPVDVLIRGETGTGKELLARVIHERSGRRQGRFVAVDCGAIPEDLAESALFGHKKGAFTGAAYDHAGLLEQADGGTLFLDEIGNLSPILQAKLLRALQNREIWRLGDQTARPVDFRVLAATHVDLETEAAAGRFRADLYHRLADLVIVLPPLRERAGDVALLAHLFLDRHRSRFGMGPCELSPEALACLERFDWPGNVRQLENAMKQAALLAEGRLEPAQLPAEIQQGPSQVLAPAPVPGDTDLPIPEGLMRLWDLEQRITRDVEPQAIQAALAEAGQDRDKAALLLDIHPKTLARKMRQYGL